MNKHSMQLGTFLLTITFLWGFVSYGWAQSNTSGNLTTNDHGCVKWGPDSSKTVEKLSLYHEFYKQKSYDDALEHWWYVFNNAPGAKEYPYIHGIKMFKTKLKRTEDEAKKQKLADLQSTVTLLWS